LTQATYSQLSLNSDVKMLRTLRKTDWDWQLQCVRGYVQWCQTGR